MVLSEDPAMTADAPGTSRGVRTLVALGVIVAALTLRWMNTTHWSLVDLADFVEGGRSVLEGRQIYDPIPGVLQFNYPPFGAVVMVPLAGVGSALAAWTMTLTSLACYLVVCTVVARRLRLSRMTSILVLLGGLALEPLSRLLALGQINLVLAGLVVLDIFVVPARYRGVLTGLAAGVKLTPAVFIVYFLLKRDWRAAVRAGVSFLSTVAVGWVLAPASSKRYWLEDLDKTQGFGGDAVMGANQSVRAVLVHALGTERPSPLVWMPLAAAALVVAIVVARRCVVRGDDVAAILCLALGGLLASPISWTHHWVWVVPAIMYTVARRRLLVAWVVAGLFYVAPMWFLPAGGGAELRYSPGQVVVSAAYVIAGVVGLGLLAAEQRGRPIPATT